MISPDRDQDSERKANKPALRRLRLLALLITVLLLIWLPFEDTGMRWVILFAAAIATWGAARVLVNFQTDTKIGLLIYPAVGIIAGLSVTVIAVLLMVFKNGLHGHNSPDFTFEQIAAFLPYTLLWTAAGFVIGLGLLLWNSARRNS